MAQIWITYAEFGELTSCSAEAARDVAMAHGYDRRRSHDDVTRVKLPAHLAETYMMNFALSRIGEASSVATLDGAPADAVESRAVEMSVVSGKNAAGRRRAA